MVCLAAWAFRFSGIETVEACGIVVNDLAFFFGGNVGECAFNDGLRIRKSSFIVRVIAARQQITRSGKGKAASGNRIIAESNVALSLEIFARLKIETGLNPHVFFPILFVKHIQ